MTGAMNLIQRLNAGPHSPIENPDLTFEAENSKGNLDKILKNEELSPHERMVNAESILLSKWKYAGEWKQYLDSPLIAHGLAALTLKNKYDAVVGIREAGLPYSSIFEIFGFPAFEIDYSCHRRGVEKPVVSDSDLESLKHKKSVLITDIDIITGKTLREVTNYLREKSVNVCGAYIGLSEWPGMETEGFSIGSDTVNFRAFWKGRDSEFLYARHNKILCEAEFIPSNLELYTSNKVFGENSVKGSMASRRIARYLKNEK